MMEPVGLNDPRASIPASSGPHATGSADAGKHGPEIGVVSDDEPDRSADHEGMIVVGIDGSEGAARALDFAANEATLRGRGLRVVAVWHVPMPVYSGGMIAAFPTDEFEHSMKAAADRQVSQVLARCPDLRHELIVQEGNAAQVLLEQSSGADMLVLGSRGLGGFRGLLLGSVGQQCAHHATCPVVIVPASGG
jgi:nucleotide-binding universal stress UspA family protein